MKWLHCSCLSPYIPFFYNILFNSTFFFPFFLCVSEGVLLLFPATEQKKEKKRKSYNYAQVARWHLGCWESYSRAWEKRVQQLRLLFFALSTRLFKKKKLFFFHAAFDAWPFKPLLLSYLLFLLFIFNPQKPFLIRFFYLVWRGSLGLHCIYRSILFCSLYMTSNFKWENKSRGAHQTTSV